MAMCHCEHRNPKLSTRPTKMIGDEDLKLTESTRDGFKRHVTKVTSCVICGNIILFSGVLKLYTKMAVHMTCILVYFRIMFSDKVGFNERCHF